MNIENGLREMKQSSYRLKNAFEQLEFRGKNFTS